MVASTMAARFQYNLAHRYGFLLEDDGYDVDWDEIDCAAEAMNEVVRVTVRKILHKHIKEIMGPNLGTPNSTQR